jgi:phage-related minor tail protein
MKKDQLQALGLTDEQIEAVLAAHGKEIQREQKAAKALQDQIETLTAQAKELSDKVAAEFCLVHAKFIGGRGREVQGRDGGAESRTRKGPERGQNGLR